MSVPTGRVTLVTTAFDAMLAHYRDGLGWPQVDAWDRANGRGVVLQAPGMGVELLDARRDSHPFGLHPPGERVHLVIEVHDAAAARTAIHAPATAGELERPSWCAAAFRVRDPDGIATWFVQR